MKKILIIIFAVSLFILGRNLLFPTFTKKEVLYHRDILGHITLAEDYTYMPPYPTSTPNPYTIKFDVTKIKVGDKVGSMTIVKIIGFKASPPSNEESLIQFNGQISVTGVLSYYDNNTQLGENVCMDGLDENSLRKIPALVGNTGTTSFCFNNWQTLKDLFKLNKEKSKISTSLIIDNYFIHNVSIDGFNQADFISLVK